VAVLVVDDLVAAAAFSVSSPASSCADPMCSISRDPRLDEWTICTATAPDAVFTVRTYRTAPAYGPGLVRKSDPTKTRNPTSAHRPCFRPLHVSQVRFVCAQPVVTSWSRRTEELTFDKTDDKDECGSPG
jgi:hypothetical protein